MSGPHLAALQIASELFKLPPNNPDKVSQRSIVSVINPTSGTTQPKGSTMPDYRTCYVLLSEGGGLCCEAPADITLVTLWIRVAEC